MSLEVNQTNNLDPQATQEQIREQLEALANDPSINKPSDEEVKQYADEYEAASVEFETTRWDVGTADQGQMLLDFIRHYSRERHLWKQHEWMGVIKMQEELDLVEKQFQVQAGADPIAFEYKALEFIFHMLQNPGGIGYQAALDFDAESETYVQVFNTVAQAVETSRKALKDLDFLQQRWQAAAQGFYLEKEDGVAQEEGVIETDPEEGKYYDEELGRDVLPGEPEYKIEVFQQMMQEKYAQELAEAQAAEAAASEAAKEEESK